MILKQLFTQDDYVLPVSSRSSKMAKKGATRKNLAVRGWKLVGNADIDISSPISTASASVENLDPLDGDRGAVVNGNPGKTATVCVAYCITVMRSHIISCVSVDTPGCLEIILVWPPVG